MTGEHDRLKRLTAWCAGFVYLFAYLSGFAHDLEERHVECPEHGHVIHLDGDIDSHHAESEEDEPIALSAIPTNDHSDHDHCGLILMMNAPRIVVAHAPLSGLLEPVEIETSEAFVPSTPIRGPTLEIFALAPKTSPPHIA